jgi:hypothetical protein
VDKGSETALEVDKCSGKEVLECSDIGVEADERSETEFDIGRDSSTRDEDSDIFGDLLPRIVPSDLLVVQLPTVVHWDTVDITVLLTGNR